MTALRVLHVDDEPDIREVVEISLGLDPIFETRSCASGPDALVAAADWHPDIILLDIMMPSMDGRATLEHLRRNPETAEIPVVFMTARAQTRELDYFRSLGAVGAIAKPFDPMTLAVSVRGFLPATGRIDELREVFLQRVNDDTSVLEKHRTALRNGTIEPDTLFGIRGIAHALAGAGGMFNLRNISNAAALVEEAVIVETHGSGSIDDVAEAVDRLLACMEISGK